MLTGVMLSKERATIAIGTVPVPPTGNGSMPDKRCTIVSVSPRLGSIDLPLKGIVPRIVVTLVVPSGVWKRSKPGPIGLAIATLLALSHSIRAINNMAAITSFIVSILFLFGI